MQAVITFAVHNIARFTPAFLREIQSIFIMAHLISDKHPSCANQSLLVHQSKYLRVYWIDWKGYSIRGGVRQLKAEITLYNSS